MQMLWLVNQLWVIVPVNVRPPSYYIKAISGENLCRIFKDPTRPAKTHTDLQRPAKILQRSSKTRIFEGSSKIS